MKINEIVWNCRTDILNKGASRRARKRYIVLNGHNRWLQFRRSSVPISNFDHNFANVFKIQRNFGRGYYYRQPTFFSARSHKPKKQIHKKASKYLQREFLVNLKELFHIKESSRYQTVLYFIRKSSSLSKILFVTNNATNTIFDAYFWTVFCRLENY